MSASPSALTAHVHVRRRYARSINLERDLGLVDSVAGYVLSPRAADSISRIVDAASAVQTHRAWTLTGVYGTGKSAFAHFLTCLAAPAQTPERQEALRIVRRLEGGRALANAANRAFQERGFVRAVAMGQREPLARTVVRGLVRGAALFWERRAGKRPEVLAELQTLADKSARGAKIEPQRLLALVQGVANASKTGVLLVLDELGKNLEYASRTPGGDDLFLLQQLAELPTTPGHPPVLLVGLLHQAFADYAASLAVAQRTEWAKVHGRFEDVAFAESPEHMLRLIGAALEQDLPSAMQTALGKNAAKWEGFVRQDLNDAYLAGLLDRDVIAAVYPLHPVAALVLPGLCARYAQHDRSLFTFLTSHEPHGFQRQLAERVASSSLQSVQLQAIYDYFVESAGGGLTQHPQFARWAEVHGIVTAAQALEPDALAVLKTIGTLNLLAGSGALRASRGLVIAALLDRPDDAAGRARIEAALTTVEEKGLVTYRRQVDEYRVWEGSDFNVELAVRTHVQTTGIDAVALLSHTAPLGPVVAHRHSYQRGTLRIFERRYLGPTVDLATLTARSSEVDGVLGYWTAPEPPGTVPARTADGRPLVLIMPNAATVVTAAAAEAAALSYLEHHAPELQRDGVARREVRHRRVLAQRALDAALRESYAAASGQTCWVGGTAVRLTGARLNHELSSLCDEVYPDGPKLWNELINRRELTSQGARARRDLIEVMLRYGTEERLGLVGDGPEVSMYASLLHDTGIHRVNAGESDWSFGPPTKPGMRAVWEAVEQFCLDARSAPASIDELFARLAAPPYGVKAGIVPVLLAAVLLYHADDISVYKDGTFVPALGVEHFELLMRHPGRFAVKHFELVGLRWEVFKELELLLSKPENRVQGGRNRTLLGIVRPLVRFATGLEQYTLKTKALSSTALAVRETLLTSREPDLLLFRGLPTACGFEPFPLHDTSAEHMTDSADTPAAFRRRLLETLRELQGAYERLLDRSRGLIHTAFEVASTPARLREELRVRALPLVGRCVEPKLRRVVLALTSEVPDDREWLVALIMVIADRPAETWTDDDAVAFELAVGDIARRFSNLEALHHDLAATRQDGFDARRVTITAPDGQEVHRFVWLGAEQREAVDTLVRELLRHVQTIPAEQQAAVAAALAEAVLRPADAPMLCAPATPAGEPAAGCRKTGGTRRG